MANSNRRANRQPGPANLQAAPTASPPDFARVALALAIVLALLPAASGPLHAQFDAHLGRLVGTVTGPDGAVIPNAEVTAMSAETGQQRTTATDAVGRYQIGALRPGVYSVTAASPDFAASEIENVTVNVGRAVRVDIPMALEVTYSTIDVSTSLVDAILPASSSVVTDDVFSDLPINGRRFHDFALLTPTVQVSRAAGHLSFGAQRGIYTNVTVDGSDYNQSFFGGIQGGERAGSIITVPQSAVQEFQAVTSGFTAEYGRTTSGVVNVSTKSGGNELHGDAFYQIRHPDLGVADPFGARVLEQLQQFGGSAGGPLRPNKAFWFVAVERQKAESPRYVEFPLLDVADRDRGAEAFDHYAGLEEPFDATNDAWAMTPRFDVQLDGRNQLMVRYNYSTANAVNSVSIGEGLTPRTTDAVSNNGTESDSIHFLTAQWTGLLSPRVVNQFRFTFTREQRPRTANSSAPLVSTAIGDFGTRSFLPTIETDARPLVSNSLTVTAGSHNLKFGGEWDRIWIDDIFGYHQFGQFILFGSDPDQILDALTPGGQIANRFDAPGIYLRQIGNTIGEQSLGHAALYAQDSWRVAPEWTLDLGFRWSAQFNQAPWAGNQTLVDRVRNADFPSGRVDPAFLPSSTRQFMPRLGFAYSPRSLSDRMVVRGSFGVFYATTPPVFVNGGTKAFRQPPFNLSVTLPTSFPTVYQQFLAAGIDLNRQPLAQLPVLSVEEVTRALDGDPLLGASPGVISPDFRNPRSVKYTVGFEHALTARTVAGMEFMHHRTSQLHGRREYNLPESTVRPDDPARIPFYDTTRRPAPLVGPMAVTESIGRARYTGVTSHWKYRGERVQLVAHYTYARAFSSDANEGFFWGPLYTDNAVPEAEYGPANLDMRHQLTAHAVWNLPGGFTWSAIVRTASAPPMSAAAGLDLNGDLHTADRALQAPGQYFTRNTFRNRGMRNVDFRLLRSFRFSDTTRAEISLELFNALNIDNVEYAGFNTVYGTGVDLATGATVGPNSTFRQLRGPDGGYDRNNSQIPGAGPLQLQIGARFYF